MPPTRASHVWEISWTENQGTLRLSGVTDVPEAKEALLKTLKEKKIKFKDRIKILPEENLKNLTGVVRLSVANVRTAPRILPNCPPKY